MLWVLVSVFLVIWTIISRWKNRRLISLAKQLGPRSIALPFIGHAYRFLGDDEGTSKKSSKIIEQKRTKNKKQLTYVSVRKNYVGFYKLDDIPSYLLAPIERMTTFKRMGKEAIENGGLMSQWQGNRLYIIVADPEPAEILLKTCLEKDDVMKISRILLGNGSIFAPVSIWRPRRKILAPTFSPKNLNSFVEVFSRQSSIMADQLRTVAERGAFSVWKYVTTYTMDSICETTLGIKVNAQHQPEQPFLQAVQSCCRIDAKRVCQPWLYNNTVYRVFCTDDYELHTNSKELIWNFINKIIASKWDSLKKEKLEMDSSHAHTENMKSFLELLIASSAGYGNVELREETLVIVLAGTDTSAVGIAFATSMLAMYPDVQEKVYEELQEVFGDSDRPVAPEDLPHLKYLDAVIKETLRLYPPVPFIVRKVNRDVTLPSGVTLVEGCGIFINIWSIHRNPRYWGEDAELFRPERFIDTPLKHPAAFMPFSHGPRSCLGYQYAMMSMKTALATLVRKYRVLPSATKNNRTELRVKFDIMLRDVDKFVVQLELRT